MYDAGNDLAPSKKKPLIKPKATIEKIPPQPDLTQEKKSIETLGVNVTTTHGAKEVRQELEQKQTKKADLVSAQTPNEQETPRFSSKVWAAAQTGYSNVDNSTLRDGIGREKGTVKRGFEAPVHPRVSDSSASLQQQEARFKEELSSAGSAVFWARNTEVVASPAAPFNLKARSQSMEQPDFGEVFQKGGIAGVIRKAMDYTNMKWQSKNNRTALAFVGLLGFGGKKLLDRATDGKQKWYQKAGIIAATMFGTEAITGESLFTGIKKLLTGGFSVAALSEQLNQLFTGANGEAPEKAIYLKNLGLLGIIGGTAPMEQFLTRDQQWAQNPQAYAYWRKKNQAILLSPELKELSDATLMEHFNQSFPETYQSGMVENFLAGYGINAAAGDQSRKKLTAQQLQDRLVNRNVEMNTWLGQQGKKLKADKVHEVNPYLIREDYLPERTFAQMEAAGFFEADLENNQSNERQDEKARMIDQVDPLASLPDTSPQKNKT